MNLSLVGMFCWVIYVFMTDQELVLYTGSIFDIILNILFAVLVYRYYDKDKE